jgi:hypothetical protein
MNNMYIWKVSAYKKVSDVSMKFKLNKALSKYQNLKAKVNFGEKKQAMNVQRNIETRSRNQFWREKATNTYSDGVSVVVVIQHAMCMRRIISFICGLSCSTIFFCIIS